MLFSIRNAFRKKAVAVLAILGVAFGCGLITFLFSLTAGMEKRIEGTFNNLSGQITITQKGSMFGGLLQGVGSSSIPASYINIIEDVPHVNNVTGQVTAILRPAGATLVMPLFGYGVSGSGTGANKLPFQNIIEGAAPVHDDEIAIGKSLQEYLAVTGIPYEVGGSYTFEVPGSAARARTLQVTGVYRTGNELQDGSFSGTEQLVREIGRLQPGRLSAISAQAGSMEYIEEAVREIEQRLAGQKPEVQVSVPRELLLPLKNVLRIMEQFFLAISLVAVVAGSLTIMVVMLLSIIERRREFGILKALGWTPRNIVFMVMVESITLSLLGAAIGVALGYGGLAAVKDYLSIEIGVLGWPVAAAVIACGALVGAVGGVYPAWRANRAAPAEIMRGV
ncbi:MAG: ABC transporter permease [Desulfotomaculaceae bacterium]|nr:ABC transporter permease [Desulfotomaculaceae bacterium]